MSPCPRCGQSVDPLRSRAVVVRDGKVIAYCSKECLSAAPTKDGAESKPVIEIASTAPAKRDDTIGKWAIGDDTAIRKYSERATAEHAALPIAKKRWAMLVFLLLLLVAAGGFGVYHY
jgi:hypothetical protein